MADRAAPTATDPSGGQRCRSGRREEIRRSSAPAATDRLAPLQCARRSGAWQHSPLDEKTDGVQASLRSPFVGYPDELRHGPDRPDSASQAFKTSIPLPTVAIRSRPYNLDD